MTCNRAIVLKNLLGAVRIELAQYEFLFAVLSRESLTGQQPRGERAV
ncbi:MAG: hypothetical protein OJF52_002120 [Nitrospira sp.]|nr:MAG: hypothetical protein OJF52_002120 [Nitrospira sp.]